MVNGLWVAQCPATDLQNSGRAALLPPEPQLYFPARFIKVSFYHYDTIVPQTVKDLS